MGDQGAWPGNDFLSARTSLFVECGCAFATFRSRLETRSQPQARCRRDALVSWTRSDWMAAEIQSAVVRDGRSSATMRDQNAQQLLAKVMGCKTKRRSAVASRPCSCLPTISTITTNASVPASALWRVSLFGLTNSVRMIVRPRSILSLNGSSTFQIAELSHLVQSAYPDLIVQERLQLVAEEQDILPIELVRSDGTPDSENCN